MSLTIQDPNAGRTIQVPWVKEPLSALSAFCRECNCSWTPNEREAAIKSLVMQDSMLLDCWCATVWATFDGCDQRYELIIKGEPS